VVYAIPEHGVTLSPVARYFMSYHATEAGAAKVRQLDLYPAVTVDLPDRWSLAFYPKNPITYNDVTNKWLVPIDVMLTNRVTKSLELGLGSAYALVKDDPQYKYVLYGRVTLYF
jgi:hypothetical protein